MIQSHVEFGSEYAVGVRIERTQRFFQIGFADTELPERTTLALLVVQVAYTESLYALCIGKLVKRVRNDFAGKDRESVFHISEFFYLLKQSHFSDRAFPKSSEKSINNVFYSSLTIIGIIIFYHFPYVVFCKLKVPFNIFLIPFCDWRIV